MNRWHTWSQLCGTLFVVHSVLRSSPHRLEVLLLQLLCGRPADDVALRVGGAEWIPAHTRASTISSMASGTGRSSSSSWITC